MSDDSWEGDRFLPKYENSLYDEMADTPSMSFLVGQFNTISFPICLDTGAGKSLMNAETFRRIDHEGSLQLKPQFRGFEAVNGSRIHCQGSIIIKLMLMGERMNYVGYFKFFIVESLAVDALIGIDEIYRHKIRINANEGFACHDDVGKLKSNLIFKSPYDIGTICLDKSTSQTETESGHEQANHTVNAENVEDDALEMGISIEPDDLVDECDFGLNESDLSEEDKLRAKSLVHEYKDLFQWGDGPLSCAHKYEHEIRLVPGARPVRHKPRRFSTDQEKLVNNEVEKLLRQGIIEKSNSPWSSRLVLAWNHYKQHYRVCLDLRDLNSRCLSDAYPLPNLSDLLQRLAGNRNFSIIDLYQGFHQYNLKKECREFTAFQTPRNGLVHYIRVPFGAKTAPNGFSRLMEEVLGDLRMNVALVFIDDVCVFASSVDESLQRTRQVFDKLRQAGMKLRPSKCRLLQVKVEYLGSMVSKDGISVAKRIIDAVTDFKRPTDAKSVMRFAGLCNFYREHVRNFADIMSPLTNLTKKSVKFVWTNECENAFERMKQSLTSAPIRNYIDFSLPIVLSCDASSVGLGATLSNIDENGNSCLIAYGSQVLKGPQLNWCVTEKELFSIFTFVKKFRHYLSGRKFLVQSDHSALQYINGSKDATGKICRMLNYLQSFDFEIHHLSGSCMEQIGPDILSRSMLPVNDSPQDVLAKRMERPVLRLNSNFSPFLSSYFSLESPKESWFDEDSNLIISKETLGYDNPQSVGTGQAPIREEHIYVNLRRILKQNANEPSSKNKRAKCVDSVLAETMAEETINN